MRLLAIWAVILPLWWMAGTSARAQPPAVRVDTVAGMHTAVFETPRGTIRVHVPSDASPGDLISGAILAEPAGATPQDQKANLNELNSLVLEWQDQRTPVSTGRYEWRIPPALRAGTGALLLRDREERPILQASIPVDPVPAAPQSSADAFEFPSDGEVGKAAVIHRRSDGRLSNTTLTLGGAEVALLASSPRQLAFRVPVVPSGPVPFSFTSDERKVGGTLRVLDLRLSASRTELFRGQRATLTITVRGLSGITAPMTLTVVNHSPAAVRVDNIDRPITIAPRQVQRGGTFELTRRITGVQPGPFQIAASVGQPPLTQFDVQQITPRILAGWQARTGVEITGGARELIQRSMLDTRLNEFLGLQQAHGGDAQDVFAALLAQYCFDLRDDGLSRRRATLGVSTGIRLVALGQNRAPAATITEREVRRLSFSDFASRLTERFKLRQAVGYLFVRSKTPQAPITIDGEHNGELTDRRFVTPVGDHQIVVTGSQACRQRVTVSAFQTRVVDCGV